MWWWARFTLNTMPFSSQEKLGNQFSFHTNQAHRSFCALQLFPPPASLLFPCLLPPCREKVSKWRCSRGRSLIASLFSRIQIEFGGPENFNSWRFAGLKQHLLPSPGELQFPLPLMLPDFEASQGEPCPFHQVLRFGRCPFTLWLHAPGALTAFLDFSLLVDGIKHFNPRLLVSWIVLSLLATSLWE